MRLSTSLFIIFLLIGSLTLPLTLRIATASTLVVPDDYPTIQEAINAASEGDTVFVRNGTYPENVVINKTLSLIGQDRAATAITGLGNNNISPVLILTDDAINVMNFTLSAVYTPSLEILNCSDINIENCTISTTAIHTYLSASIVQDAQNITLKDCKIQGNSDQGASIVMQNTSSSTIERCQLVGTGGPLTMIQSDGNKISRSQIQSNRSWDGSFTPAVKMDHSNNNTFFWNDISAAPQGVYADTPLMILDNSSFNIFYQNNLYVWQSGEEKTVLPPSVSHPNIWDDGYPSGGNYWGDYQGVDVYRGPLQDENGSDGIIDVPYNISLDNIDHYPLSNICHPPPWYPIASFDFMPLTPLVNDTITFDAINSYDFDGSIVSYAWDFGDGNDTIITTRKIDHAYINSGTYNASLTVTDNEGLNTTLTKAISIEKLSSSISISVSMETITVRENTTISGVITPARENANVTIWNRYVGYTTWSVLAEVTSDANSEYSYNWVPSKTGAYSLKASWSGDAHTLQNESAPINFECLNISSSIAISTSCASTYVGFKANITGTLQDMYGNRLANETVVLYYTFSGIGTWTPITSDITDNQGDYFATWIPTATGYFVLKVEWAGNATYSEIGNTATLSSLPYNDQYVFSVESNSTVSELAFNTTDWALSFLASGPGGTAGYVRVTTAKTLVPNPENIKVYLDGNQKQFSIISIDDSWLLTFAYSHSSHQIQVDFDITRPDHTPPVANAGPDRLIDEGVEVQFDGSNSTDNVGIAGYVWTFVDGTPKNLSGIAPTYTFSNPGNYTVTLNVTDAAGNWAADTVIIAVRDITPPIISSVIQNPSSDVGVAQIVWVSANITDVGSGVKNASLIYSYDNGSSWRPPYKMFYNSTSGLYEAAILGHIYGTWIKYKITAYDNAGNLMIDDNAGQYYSYQVIPEFPATYVILLFILTTALATTTYRKRARKRV